MRDEKLTKAVLDALSNTTAVSRETVCASASIMGWKVNMCVARPPSTRHIPDQPVEYDGRQVPLWQWMVESEIKRLRNEGYVKPARGGGSWMRTWKGELAAG